MVQVVLPNDANPLGFILGGTVMHLIDIAGAIAAIRHTRSLLVTAAVDGLQFLHPIKVGDLIILKARVTCAFTTSLEVEVEVYLGGDADRQAAADEPRLSDIRGARTRRRARRMPPLLVETDEERRLRRPRKRGDAAHLARAADLDPRSDRSSVFRSVVQLVRFARRARLQLARCSCRG